MATFQPILNASLRTHPPKHLHGQTEMMTSAGIIFLNTDPVKSTKLDLLEPGIQSDDAKAKSKIQWNGDCPACAYNVKMMAIERNYLLSKNERDLERERQRVRNAEAQIETYRHAAEIDWHQRSGDDHAENVYLRGQLEKFYYELQEAAGDAGLKARCEESEALCVMLKEENTVSQVARDKLWRTLVARRERPNNCVVAGQSAGSASHVIKGELGRQALHTKHIKTDPPMIRFDCRQESYGWQDVPPPTQRISGEVTPMKDDKDIARDPVAGAEESYDKMTCVDNPPKDLSTSALLHGRLRNLYKRCQRELVELRWNILQLEDEKHALHHALQAIRTPLIRPPRSFMQGLPVNELLKRVFEQIEMVSNDRNIDMYFKQQVQTGQWVTIRGDRWLHFSEEAMSLFWTGLDGRSLDGSNNYIPLDGARLSLLVESGEVPGRQLYLRSKPIARLAQVIEDAIIVSQAKNSQTRPA